MVDPVINKLKSQLSKNPKFIDDSNNSLLKNNIINATLTNDDDLLDLLLEDDVLFNHFFYRKNNIYVFKNDEFLDYIVEKNIFDNSYTKFKNKIGLTVDGKFFNERDEIALVFPFKDCVLEAGMDKEESKRGEIFFNEILAKEEIDKLFDKKVLFNFRKISEGSNTKFTKFDRRSDGSIKNHLIINGNNLLALHTIKQEFQGKVKLLYIDPPYNTKTSFTYNNNFKFSTWLTFMKNRLEVAKKFLREDGFAAITIDEEFLFYLGVLADEIFGRENKVGVVSIVINPMGRQNEKFFSDTVEYMLVYAKDITKAKFNPVVLSEKAKEEFKYKDDKGEYKLMPFLHDHKKGLRENKPNNWYPLYVNDDLSEISLENKDGFTELMPISKRNVERSWQTIKETTQQRINENELVAQKEEDGIINIFYKYRKGERIFDYWDLTEEEREIADYNLISTNWDNSKYNANHHGKRYLQDMIKDGEVSFPKSIYAVMDVIKLTTSKDDIILDFFAGSGTTGEAVLNINAEYGGNRQFILIEQLKEHVHVTKQRINKAVENSGADNDIIYFELTKYNQKALELIQECKTSEDIIDLWNFLCEEYFLKYNIEINEINENLSNFDLNYQKEVLCEVLNKNQLYINLSEIDDVDFNIDEDIKSLNKEFYGDYDGF